jgi:phosphatidylinositol alpha-1,6-mannosyltransferase
MRLLVITELFLPTKGGTAVWFAEVYRRLGGKGIHIVTADVPGAAEFDHSHPNAVHRLALKRYRWLRPESLLMYVKLLGTSVYLAARHRVTAVHAGRVLPEGLVAWLSARLVGSPALVYVHGEELTGWGRGRKYEAMRYVLRHVDRVVANSDFTKEQVIGMGVAADRVALISPGVDTDVFRPGLPCEDLRTQIGVSPDAKLILSVGRLQERKGFDQIIRSLPALRNAGIDAHYALIGIGEDRLRLETLGAQHGVVDQLHFLGHVPPSDLPRWYNACDVFAMPNREINGDTEGFGIVYLEAAACAKPAIAGRAGGTGSAVVHNMTGVQVDGANIASVRAALENLLFDTGRAAVLGAAGRDRAVRDYSWSRVAEQTRRIILDRH